MTDRIEREVSILERMLARAQQNKQPVMSMLLSNALFQVKTSPEYLDAERRKADARKPE